MILFLSSPSPEVPSFLWELHCCFPLIYHTVLLPCVLASFSSPTRSEYLRAGFSPTDNLLIIQTVPGGPWPWPDMERALSTPTTPRVRVMPPTLPQKFSYFQRHSWQTIHRHVVGSPDPGVGASCLVLFHLRVAVRAQTKKNVPRHENCGNEERQLLAAAPGRHQI